ncbi:MarR family transcriptional regulator [Microbacterium sp. Leaf320]|uniref:MarR family transcriptional regulator n=1 Tax=Microbacterium sp. Leaf320 TaxID=1736334 RepID=UPI0039E103E1
MSADRIVRRLSSTRCARTSRMSAESDSYIDAAALVRTRVHIRVIDFVRENPGAHVADILEGTAISRGTLGRVLRVLAELNVLVVDLPFDKRSSARRFRYTLNEARIDDLLAALPSRRSPARRRTP